MNIIIDMLTVSEDIMIIVSVAFTVGYVFCKYELFTKIYEAIKDRIQNGPSVRL